MSADRLEFLRLNAARLRMCGCTMSAETCGHVRFELCSSVKTVGHAAPTLVNLVSEPSEV